MMDRFCHALLFCLLTGVVFPVGAEPTRLMVVYAEADELAPGSFSGMISGMERTPGVEVLRLALDGITETSVAQMLHGKSRQQGLPLRLAAAGGQIGAIAVIYPDVGEPYRGVFARIIEGIEEKTRNKVTSYAVGSNFNAQDLSSELKRQDIQVVIALGRNGLKAASGLDKGFDVIVGGVISAQDMAVRGGTVLSLAPDPALLFARLKALSPKTQRVCVVFDPRQNGWLIKLAQSAARTQGIELLAREAADLKTALTHYQHFFATADAQRDALWLPQDSVAVEESAVLPMILQESWSKKIAVFSSNAAHVKRGVLFALYPNNMEMGRNLAVSAIGVASGASSNRGTLPLREVLTAFNTRTASHLNLDVSSTQLQGFDLLFPEH